VSGLFAAVLLSFCGGYAFLQQLFVIFVNYQALHPQQVQQQQQQQF
jgi:hypothetical protein